MVILLPYSKKRINLRGEKATFFPICFFPFPGKRETMKVDSKAQKEELPMHPDTKKLRKFAGKLLFVGLLLGLLYYSFRDSLGDMLTELAKVSPSVILLLFLTVLLYHVCEGHITWLIVHKTHPEYTRWNGFCNAFYTSFYKTATLGSGSGIAAIYYLNRSGIPVPNATGMYFFQYIVHKVSMAVYSLLLFFMTYSFIHGSFADYQGYIFLGFLGGCVIAGVLSAVAVVPWMQTACNLLASRFRKKHPAWEEKLTGAGHKLALLQAESRALLKDPLLLLRLFLCNLLKFTTWYVLPWFIFGGSAAGDLPFTALQCFSLTALSQSLAGVIPTPAGIGSVEAVFVLLFRRLLPEGKALSAVVLYRVDTMLLPCVIGAFFVLGEKIASLRRKKIAEH